MAYDKIIVIHSRLDRCLDYVQNDGKTDLGNAVDYICDPVKAGFQTAINCTLDKSFLQMQETKRRWDKHGGILGYHIIHSYAPGEVTPEQAHEAGVEFARRLLGDKYEAVVCTHTDRDHLHCHIVFNSVSSVPVLSVNISDGVDMPIIMYHSVLKDTDLSGKYIVTPDTLKNDINFLKNKGYTFVSAQELIDYTNGTSKLPDKPVMLTFDDGFYNNYGYVMPILSEYDAKAVISVVGSYTDEYSKSNIANMTYGYVRWSEVYDMFIDKRVEVGNHSYDFHSNNHGRNGSKRNSGESEDTYKNIFVADTQKAQDRFMTKTGFAPIIYTYPFGAYSEETTDMLKSMGFKMSLTCNEGINHITDADSLFMLKRYNRPSGISTADFFAKMGID